MDQVSAYRLELAGIHDVPYPSESVPQGTLCLARFETSDPCACTPSTGTHTGEFNGIAATGNTVEFTFVDILHVVNGKVVKEHFELNPMTFMQQIGAMPAMAAM